MLYVIWVTVTFWFLEKTGSTSLLLLLLLVLLLLLAKESDDRSKANAFAFACLTFARFLCSLVSSWKFFSVLLGSGSGC